MQIQELGSIDHRPIDQIGRLSGIGRGLRLQLSFGAKVGNFAGPDFDISLHSFCTESSSPLISAILVGHFTKENDSLRKSSQFSEKKCANKYQT